ncbi:ABC transporter substrate-binding protein [Shimia sp.]|uniref:ABC transporter substrate-binding protein n=1 Tax=Shimia sp. TaxID=1954381 RepID=UPI003BAD9A49
MTRFSKTGALLSAAILAGSAVVAEDITIRMAAPDWGPTRFMQDHANATYTAPSGNNVKLEIDFIPWPNFFDRVNASLNSGEQKYQMLVSDSQWLGTFIEAGHFMKLNDYIAEDEELQAIITDLHPALVSGYSTYPNVPTEKIAEMGNYSLDVNYYGFPQFPDNYFTYYRNDLFCDESENAAFQEKYGSELPCAPEAWDSVTWDDWGNFGEFFTCKAGETLAGETLDSDVYGVAYQAGKPLDFSTMQINAFFWQWGGGIWDEANEPNAQVMGVVNSDENVAGFERYLELLSYAPPIAKTGQMGIFEIQDLYMQGKIAAIIDWAALAAPVVDPATSQVADVTSFGMMPGNMLNGELDRSANLGGQPFVLTTWNDDLVVAEALNLVKWWLSEEIQIAAVKAGGQSGLTSVLENPDYDSWAPWNATYRKSLPWQKDLWHVPEMFEMLTQQQEEFDRAITGQVSARKALDAVAEFQDELLRDADRLQ